MSLSTDELNIFIPEILEHILQYVDSQTLANCRLVSKYWKETADYAGRRHGLWDRFVRKKMFNNGDCMKQKSNLNWLELYINTQLWHYMAKANVRMCKNVKTRQSLIHVYRDNLILIQDEKVIYMKIETLTELRCLTQDKVELYKALTYFDFNETDDLIMKVNLKISMQSKNFTVVLYGKEFLTHFDLDRQQSIEIPAVIKYKLEKNVCIIFDADGVAWEYMWNKKEFKKTFLAKCYDLFRNITQICIFEKNVYILIAGAQKIFMVNNRVKNFEFLCVLPKQLVLMEPYLVALNDADALNLMQDFAPSNVNMACALCHGYVNIHAYRNGLVNIHICTEKKYVNLQLSIRNIADLNEVIKCVDVYEREDSHYLFIVSATRFLQISIDYPNEIKQEVKSKYQHLM